MLQAVNKKKAKVIRDKLVVEVWNKIWGKAEMQEAKWNSGGRNREGGDVKENENGRKKRKLKEIKKKKSRK